MRESRLQAALRTALGPDAAACAMAHFSSLWPAGTRVCIPPAAGTATRATRRRRNQRIRDLRRAGVALSALSARYGLSRRQLYRILAAAPSR